MLPEKIRHETAVQAVYKPLSHDGWRKAVLSRDNYACVMCLSTIRLQADHIKPRSTHPELMRDVSNGRTLCYECHKRTPTFGGKLLKGRSPIRDPYGSR